ncbi:MAG: DUF1616 domain-containing protein [Thermoplasmata archaeon]|nr:DUF1616 domain-containing protein [Thermoplasmata archaeon]
MTVSIPLAVLGGLLVFALPGYAVTKAVFPEWRLRGPNALLTAVELATLSFVLSVVLSVLVGFVLLNTAPAGFQANWTDPRLEAALGAITALGLTGAVARGGFARVAPSAPLLEEDQGATGGWEAVRRLDRLVREERGLRRSLVAAPPGSEEERELRSRIERVRAEAASVRTSREAELAG